MKKCLILPTEQWSVGDTFFSEKFVPSSKLKEIFFGLMTQSPQKFDRHVTDELTNRLFPPFRCSQAGSDLMSRSIKRGRDHGLPSYAAFYEAFKIGSEGTEMDCWNKKPETISQANWDLLQRIYLHPHHIDLIVGGFAEQSFGGGILGKTFRHIIGKQFEALRSGDRFFFTHTGNMNNEELAQIRKRTLADILCDNTDLQRVKKNMFKRKIPMQCNTSTSLDINKFQVKSTS